ncbi:MAG: UbiA family prenyltransferase, partial [Planctomycetes bacterium]|nr:UbiA family prenyltransferase [Planctomycetota bacterium]
ATARPERPIPSGRITRRWATVLSIGLLVTGVALASMVSPGSAAVAIGIVAAIVLYDVVLKTTPIAPALMGLCRALNVLLGVSALQGAWPAVVLLPVLGVWLYITSVTVFARTEADVSSRRRLESGAGGVLLAVASLSALTIFLHPLHRGYLLVVAGLLLVVAHKARIAIRSRRPQPVQDAVKTFIFGLVIFDSAVAWSVGGVSAGCIVASPLIPAMLLSQRFRPT